MEELYRHCSDLETEEDSLNLWIVKPGENSNRGFGISVHSGEGLKKEIDRRF